MASTTITSGKGSASVGALADNVTVLCPGAASVGVNVGAGLTGTLTFEVSGDGGTSWTAIAALVVGATVSYSSTTTGAGIFVIPIAGQGRARVRCSAYTSGSAAVTLEVSAAPISRS
jgi:hypothetical protein